MIGLNTNILIRFATRDDVKQLFRVEKAFHHYQERGEVFFVNVITLCETMWVLQNSYGYSRQVVADFILILMDAEEFEVEEGKLVLKALELAPKTSAGMADILIGLKNQQLGCETTLTFDKAAAKLATFKLLA